MMIVLDEKDLTTLKASTRADLMALLSRLTSAPSPDRSSSEGFVWDEVVNLAEHRVDDFMKGCSEETISGLKVIAENGPIIAANLLKEVGIDNYGHFQGRVTKRIRTITGDRQAFLFAWDNWQSEENVERGCGHYAVTDMTFRALRSYFDLD